MSKLYSIAVASLLLIACLGKDIVTEPVENPSNESVSCTASALCRLENPADSSLLTTKQKARAVEILELNRDSAAFELSTLTLADLQKDTVSIDLSQNLRLTIDSSVFHILAILPADGLAHVEWWGTVTGAHEGVVQLYFIGDEIQHGFADIDGRFFRFIPLGGGAIFVQEIFAIWMGECSAAMKPAAGLLSCLP